MNLKDYLTGEENRQLDALLAKAEERRKEKGEEGCSGQFFLMTCQCKCKQVLEKEEEKERFEEDIRKIFTNICAFARDMTCALNTARKSCHFPDSEQDVENNGDMENGLRKAYIKGRMDILCSLAEYQFISFEVGAYMAGMNQQSFEKVLQDWKYEWIDDLDG